MDHIIADPDQLRSFAAKLLVSAGIPEQHATAVANHMTWADTHGRGNYGVWRLPILCKRAEAGLFETTADPSIVRVTQSLAIVDGHNAIGHLVATVASDVAIEMAATAGVGVVAVRASNFMGALGYYADRIAQRGMIALIFSNSHPRVAAHGGTAPVLGTNPLAFAAPRGRGRTVIVDMATAAAPGSLFTKAAELGEPLPEGLAVDRDGAPLRDASRVNEGAVLPMAGAKGFGLGLMVEILAGVLTGAGVSHGVHSMYKDFDNPGDSGHMIIALDIASLIERTDYENRMELLDRILLESGDVRIPGDGRQRAWQETLDRGGVELDAATAKALEVLAAQNGIPVPWQSRAATERADSL